MFLPEVLNCFRQPYLETFVSAYKQSWLSQVEVEGHPLPGAAHGSRPRIITSEPHSLTRGWQTLLGSCWCAYVIKNRVGIPGL